MLFSARSRLWTVLVRSTPTAARTSLSSTTASCTTTAPLPSDSAALLAPRVCNGEIWSSADGSEWELVGHARWEGRHCAGTVVHAGRMWVVGGDMNQGHYQHDVLSSADGLDWTCECEEPPWGAPKGGKFSHYTVAFAGHIWVIGGQNMAGMSSEYHSHSFTLPDGETILHDDVWRTRDGRHWEQVAADCPWAPRSAIGGTAVMDGKMWLIGGGTYNTPGRPERLFYNDVWSSADGVSWTCVSAHAPWEARQYHEIAVWDDKLWVMEGYTAKTWAAPTGAGPFVSSTALDARGRETPSVHYATTGEATGNRNDCWYSADGVTWHELKDVPWARRHAACVFVFNDSLWMVAGNNMKSDVWQLRRRGVSRL